MLDSLLRNVSKHIIYPLYDLKDHSSKLVELKRLEKTQWYSYEELKARQWVALEKIINYAYTYSPYYKHLFLEHGIEPGDIKTYDDYLQVPITTKQHIRNNLDQFISTQFNKDQLVTAKTGGSTGVSLSLFFDERCEEKRNAAAIRSDRWAGWDLGEVKASLWGNPPKADTFKKQFRNTLLDRVIYLDTMDLNPASMAAFKENWRKHKPAVIYGHAHSIYMWAKYLKNENVSNLRPKGIISTSMMLLAHERLLIEDVFQCKVSDRYGCEEVGLIASECELHKGMHLNIEHLYVEFINDLNQPIKAGESGKIVLSDFNNLAMPLLRYRVEDVGTPSDRMCECGRGLPIMEKVEGRVADFLKKKDGSLVAGISLVERTLTQIKGLEQMQMVQNALDEIQINRVKGSEYTEQTDINLRKEFAGVFGASVQIDIVDVDKIPQEASGKYRFSICKI